MRMIFLTSILIMLGLWGVKSSNAQDISEFFLLTDVRHMNLSPSGNKLAVYHEEHYNGILTDGEIKIYSSESGTLVGRFYLNNKDVQWISFLDEKRIAVFSRAYIGVVRNGFREKRRVSDVIEVYDIEGQFIETIYDKLATIANPEPPIIRVLARDTEDSSLLALYRGEGSSSRLMRFGSKYSPPETILVGNAKTEQWYLNEDLEPYLRSDVGEEWFITDYYSPNDGIMNRWDHVFTGNEINSIFKVIAKPVRENAFYVIQDSNNQDRVSLFRLPIGFTTNEELIYQHPVFDLAGAKAFGPSNRLYYAWWWDDGVKRHWFDDDLKASGESLSALLPENSNWQIIDVTRDERVWIISQQGPQSSPGTLMYNRDTKSLTHIVRSDNYIKSNRIAKTEIIKFRDGQGKGLKAYFTHGLGKKNDPVAANKLMVLMPQTPGKVDFYDWNPIALYFAGQGYDVVRPQTRGSEGKGTFHDEEAYLEVGKGIQEDISFVLLALEEGGLITADTKKYALGFSLGGYAVLNEMTFRQDTFTCGIAVNAPSDLMATLKNFDRDTSVGNYRYFVMRNWLGDPEMDKEELIHRSPIHRADQLEKPLMLVHAYDNKVVAVEQSEQFYDKAKQAGKLVRLVRFDRMGHDNISDDRMFDVLSAADTFLKTCD